MLLEKEKNLAREAAQSNFLWELGMRAPSAHQVRKICEVLAITLADEKRIKAVVRLRAMPEILQKIRDNALRISEGDKEMVEVLYGPEHYSTIAQKKDTELWNKIALDLGIPHWSDIHQKVRMGVITQEKDLPTFLFMGKSGNEMRLCAPRMAVPDDGYLLPNIYFKTGNRGPEIVIRPWWPSDNVIKCLERAKEGPELFYLDTAHTPFFGTGTISRGDRLWCDAVVSVKGKEFLSMAKKLANAYEAETRRRRKPAKAVVLKNY